MNKNLRVLAMALLAAPLLSGCFTSLAMKGMNGPGSCPVGIVPLASANAYALQNVQPGDDISHLPDPQSKEVLPLRGGEQALEVWYYRTGHEMCSYMPTRESYSLVLIDPQRRSILGQGREVIAAYRPYLERLPTHMPRDTGGRTWADDLNPFS